MTTKSLTDCYGRRLTVENGRPGIHLHASETVGPFTSEQLRAALDEVAPAGSYTRTDEDGLTLLMVQQQRDQATARAEKAEQERDEVGKMAASLRSQLAEALDRATQPRTLTPDAIEVALHDCMPNVALDRLSGTQVMRLAEDMHAALTEPPARPEGAAYWDGVIADQVAGDLAPEVIQELADIIATKSAENGA